VLGPLCAAFTEVEQVAVSVGAVDVDHGVLKIPSADALALVWFQLRLSQLCPPDSRLRMAEHLIYANGLARRRPRRAIRQGRTKGGGAASLLQALGLVVFAARKAEDHLGGHGSAPAWATLRSNLEDGVELQLVDGV
jgi:hypothetical protein